MYNKQLRSRHVPNHEERRMPMILGENDMQEASNEIPLLPVDNEPIRRRKTLSTSKVEALHEAAEWSSAQMSQIEDARKRAERGAISVPIILANPTDEELRQVLYEILWLNLPTILVAQIPLRSIVPSHLGKCRPVRLNLSTIERKQAGGVTGTFIRVRTLFGYVLWDIGRDFYGMIRDDSSVVEPTTFRGEAETWEDCYARVEQNIEFRKQFDNL